MAQHFSDDEQLETLKRWWNDNGTQLLVTVVLVVGGWFGWQQWQDYREQQVADASAVYVELTELAGKSDIEDMSEEDRTRLSELAGLLREKHEGSQYARYADLMVAKLAVAREDYETAETALRRVIDASGDDVELASIARLRLARVEMARHDNAKALALLELEVPQGMHALFAELRGDIHYQNGDLVAARAAYQAALNDLAEASSGARPLLEFKLNRVLGDEPSAATPSKEDAS